jgi:protein OS-9
MKLGHRYPYLCLIPPPLSTPQDEPDSEMTPVRSWSLLQPLSGTCLYVRTLSSGALLSVNLDYLY